MSILAWIIVGGLAGWLASLIMNTDAQQGIVGNIVVGILGAMLGGVLFSVLGLGGLAGFSLYSLAISVVGATLLIALYRAVTTT